MRERVAEHLFNRRDGMEDDAFLDLIGQLVQIG